MLAVMHARMYEYAFNISSSVRLWKEFTSTDRRTCTIVLIRVDLRCGRNSSPVLNCYPGNHNYAVMIHAVWRFTTTQVLCINDLLFSKTTPRLISRMCLIRPTLLSQIVRPRRFCEMCVTSDNFRRPTQFGNVDVIHCWLEWSRCSFQRLKGFVSVYSSRPAAPLIVTREQVCYDVTVRVIRARGRLVQCSVPFMSQGGIYHTRHWLMSCFCWLVYNSCVDGWKKGTEVEMTESHQEL